MDEGTKDYIDYGIKIGDDFDIIVRMIDDNEGF
jgi:hypothetical protein